MGPLKWFLVVYVMGGLTFVPLVLLLLLAAAYCTLPKVGNFPSPTDAHDPAKLIRDGDVNDEQLILKTGTDDLAETFHRKHDSDVATGYFAVCREYVPGGVNGKPPEKLSPAGEAVVQESPSVYQSMYRTIFDRSQKPTIEPNKEGTGKGFKRANNVFFVVLRHGHLMLYDDIQQLEVRYVISLEYHHVDIYGGEDEDIPESELWIKRNAIRLKRKATQVGDKAISLPFYFFSENLSEKEDFYHAILANQEKQSQDNPEPQNFETQHIIKLVQKLHSSEEQLQTRWLNALLGRLFLALYKTPFLEQRIRQKLTKKISRVKKPNFITKLALQKIDTGTGAPFVTNPRLKDLTVNGECVAEMDIDYTGQFRIEIAATARIDLGTRFKAREVDMVLAATCKKLSGHLLVKFKPPPSNRLWVTFEKMPKIEMSLEPIVSSRQITYTLILKAIESRILEVFAEALVLPFWDDVPFLDTLGEHHRGGIWKKDPIVATSTEIQDESPEHEADTRIENAKPTIEMMKKEDRNMSMPVLSETKNAAAIKAAKKSISSLKDVTGSFHPDRTMDKVSRPETPRVLRSSSFAAAVHPAISPTHADGATPAWDIKNAQKRDTMLKDISLKSLGSSPEGTNTESGLSRSAPSTKDDEQRSSNVVANQALDQEPNSGLARRQSAESQNTSNSRNQSSIFSAPERSDTTDSAFSISSARSQASNHENVTQRHSHTKSLTEAAKSYASGEKKQALAASALSAAQAAQKWGWGVLARNRQREADATASHDAGSQSPTTLPMGRGRPLPPPGTPLPPPEKPGLFSIAKRKAPSGTVSPANSTRASASELSNVNGDPKKVSPRSTPTLFDKPDRRARQASIASNAGTPQEDDVLVVEAPIDSNPTTPSAEHHDDFFGHGEGESEGAMNEIRNILTVTEPETTVPTPVTADIIEASSLNAVTGGALDKAEEEYVGKDEGSKAKAD